MRSSKPSLLSASRLRGRRVERFFSGTLFRLRPRLEAMEDRTLLLTMLVSNTDDTGRGSFRQAILDSNAATDGVNTIQFEIPGQGVQTIAPLSPLPAITQAVLIDGWSQTGLSGTHVIELSGQEQLSDGLLIQAPEVTVRGLVINGFEQGPEPPSISTDPTPTTTGFTETSWAPTPPGLRRFSTIRTSPSTRGRTITCRNQRRRR